MKQELYIKGEVVSYTLLTKNITAVLGKAYIYRVPTPEDVLRIVYPTWLDILDMGYEEGLVQTLTDAIQQYATALCADGTVMNKTDADNLYNLVWLLKAVLKDCYKIDVK